MRLHIALVPAVLTLALCGPATAETPQSPPAILTPEQVNPLRLLPPPPAEGSAEQKAELAELHQIQESRPATRFAEADWDGEHEDPSAFAPVLGPKFDMAELPATARLMSIVEHEQSAAKKQAKAAFHRPRPWIVDPTLVGCEHSDDKPNSSYPSGHTTMAFAMATVLADLIPERAQDVMARASEYAESRLVCGVHFRSDIVAGQAFGTTIGAELAAAPQLQPEIEAARAELRQVGIAR